MSGMLLSCANMPVIKQIADLLGVIMSGIYFVFDKIGFANIGICVIVFTLIVKLLMIPMSIKQQKTQKLSSLINPEVQAIQKKYKGKMGSNEAAMAMNAEIKAVYAKYGTTQTGGCLPMLLQMCIMIALYGVISAIPAHVGAVKDIYMEASDYIYDTKEEYSDLKNLNQIMVDNKIEGFSTEEYFDKVINAYFGSKSEGTLNDVYDMLASTYKRQNSGLNTDIDAWTDIKKIKDVSIKIIEAIKKVSDEDWEKVKKADLSEYQSDVISKYSGYSDSQLDEKVTFLKNNWSSMEEKHSDIISIYTFAGVDLSRSPSQEMDSGIWWAILIPFISAVAQWFSTYLMTKNQPSLGDNPMASSLKAMNFTMPIMSAFICYSWAAGLGLYWIVGSLFQIGQQFFINAYFKKIEVDDIIKSNLEKMEKKNAKRGLPPQAITSVANSNVKNIKVDENKKTNTSTGVTYKQGGIAAKANMVKQYNDKNNK